MAGAQALSSGLQGIRDPQRPSGETSQLGGVDLIRRGVVYVLAMVILAGVAVDLVHLVVKPMRGMGVASSPDFANDLAEPIGGEKAARIGRAAVGFEHDAHLAHHVEERPGARR